ncbi:MAG: VanZ family protein [Bacteroidota bacterium]
MPRILAALWTLLILASCSIPGRDLPRVEIVQIDKFVHAALFFGFAWLWRWAGGRTRVVLASGLVYAVMTEIYQGWLPWDRTPDPFDMLANTVGLVLGLLAWYVKSKP